MDTPENDKFEFWNSHFSDEKKQNPEEKKGNKKGEDKYKNWGKLGGRPPLSELKKTERINLFFTKKEMEILEQKAQSKNLKLNDYCRQILKEKELPNREQDQTLNQYILNFKRISNFMKAGIWNSEEKHYLEKEILEVIELLKSKLSWQS